MGGFFFEKKKKPRRLCIWILE
jgi:hypothetical protein